MDFCEVCGKYRALEDDYGVMACSPCVGDRAEARLRESWAFDPEREAWDDEFAHVDFYDGWGDPEIH